MLKLNRENILSYFLGFVVIWFGINELRVPEEWISFLPGFLADFSDNDKFREYLILGHGAALVLSGIALVFNWKRKLAAGVIALFLLAIIGSLWQSSGMTPTLVRDAGLLGMALALLIKN